MHEVQNSASQPQVCACALTSVFTPNPHNTSEHNSIHFCFCLFYDHLYGSRTPFEASHANCGVELLVKSPLDPSSTLEAPPRIDLNHCFGALARLCAGGDPVRSPLPPVPRLANHVGR
jgi:hypothetical protein